MCRLEGSPEPPVARWTESTQWNPDSHSISVGGVAQRMARVGEERSMPLLSHPHGLGFMSEERKRCTSASCPLFPTGGQ